jgi:hypothetical protein
MRAGNIHVDIVIEQLMISKRRVIFIINETDIIIFLQKDAMIETVWSGGRNTK